MLCAGTIINKNCGTEAIPQMQQPQKRQIAPVTSILKRAGRQVVIKINVENPKMFFLEFVENPKMFGLKNIIIPSNTPPIPVRLR